MATKVPKHLFARLLYPNPVCLLTVESHQNSTETNIPGGETQIGGLQRNVMTISWLTPLDNEGHIICSMKQSRFTSQLLARTTYFEVYPQSQFFEKVLNVPVTGMEQLIFSIGSCSGSSTDKFTEFGIETCTPGEWISTSHDESIPTVSVVTESTSSGTSDALSVTKKKKKKKKEQANRPPVIAISSCVAHIVCVVEEKMPRYGHNVMICRIEEAFVKNEYWDGRNFGPKESIMIAQTVTADTNNEGITNTPPALLSFLGSGRFATVEPGINALDPPL
ncbi:hypothetical protein HK098_007957 [Nowakowskiella sp. JEL0407]|nr:hypothetical protein HK098_007957 [Nowakowskiella sp. JEL0407]